VLIEPVLTDVDNRRIRSLEPADVGKQTLDHKLIDCLTVSRVASQVKISQLLVLSQLWVQLLQKNSFRNTVLPKVQDSDCLILSNDGC